MDSHPALVVEDIPRLKGPRPKGSPKIRRTRQTAHTISRRNVLKGTLVVGSIVAMKVLGVLPPARKALADGYDVYPDCNGGQNKGSSYSGCKGCCCSTVCSTCGSECCVGDAGGCWHRNDGINWWLRPNQCVWSGGAAGYDAWKWKAGTSGCANCGGSTPYAQWRCHDGYTRLDGFGAFESACKKHLGCLS